MPDERNERPGQEGFTADILREATASGTPDEPSPPEEPQGAALPRGADAEDDRGADEGRSA
jgi:hypothetical protein